MKHGRTKRRTEESPEVKGPGDLWDRVYDAVAPAYIYGNASAVTGGTLAMAYVVAMIAMLFTATSYGSMAGAFPVAGSTYSYTQRGINPHLGFFGGMGDLY